MKYLIISALFILSYLPGFSQTEFNAGTNLVSDLSNNPEPAIDEGVWQKYLSKAIDYDVAAFNDAPRGIYIVKVRFTVFEDGHVGNVVALTRFGYGLEREVVKALKKSPAWHPAIVNGKPVQADHLQTVRFVVDER